MMRSLIGSVLCLLLVAPAAQAVFLDDFQDADVSDWTAMGGNAGSTLIADLDGFGTGNYQARTDPDTWQEDGWKKSLGAPMPMTGTIEVSWRARTTEATSKHTGIVLVDENDFGIGFSAMMGSDWGGIELGPAPDLNYTPTKKIITDNRSDIAGVSYGGDIWVDLKYVWDTDSGLVEYYYNDVLVDSSTVSQTSFTATDVIMHLWAGNGKVAYDDVTVIPEPATLALLGIGAAGLVIRRKR